MNQTSGRLALPFIDPGQIDKSTTHNEALALLDLAVSPMVTGVLVNAPPPSPAIGDCVIVGASPSGAFAGHAFALAGYTAGGWRFVAAAEGLTATVAANGEPLLFRGGAWETGLLRGASLAIGGNQVIGSRGGAVADPSGGGTVDIEARTAITAILARLRQHGLIAS